MIDSNVLLDIAKSDPEWQDWSSTQLANCARKGRLAINAVIFAEVSCHYSNESQMEAAFPQRIYARHHLPFEAALLAGKAFMKYRAAGGVKRSPLPDFYIGAHAQTMGYTLVSRDKARYRTYFPKLKLIAPK
ncbi:MAG: type II toxin-antitoxin system VapC family toxin [Gammaproteobacteria bacterium]|nr:type II toxin-antitoxin system VapC family toxin [Gammaproteobacteria bacterium]MBU1440372.1 type II toxin-antitoxin system VapC family toxin [Gammaproteobacteria bacterium]MBU2407831.1 type II toxin-antitoxin system VapC family toxin [Gammaproteobacteria bacterium]